MTNKRHDIIIAITGASGAAYAMRLIQRLGQYPNIHQHLLISDAAKVVCKQELDIQLPDTSDRIVETLAKQLAIPVSSLRTYAEHDWFSPVASGSAGIQKMVVVPCSMGSLARIATGISSTLLERAADVMLKEKRQLILVPRETPLSTIHLENMLKLSHMGAHILPAMPGFYHRPTDIEGLIDFIVDRIVEHLDVGAAKELKQWGA